MKKFFLLILSLIALGWTAGAQPKSISVDVTGKKLETVLNEIGEQSGLPLRLRDTGRFDRSRIDEIAEKALNDGAMIVNPAYFSKEDVAGLLLGAE